MAKTKLICLKNPPKRIDNPLYIGRGSKWGNPHRISRTMTREQAVQAYRRTLWADKKLLAALPELQGKTLMCFCETDQLCHGQVLISALKWMNAKVDEQLAGQPKLDDPALIPSRWKSADDHETERQLAIHDAF